MTTRSGCVLLIAAIALTTTPAIAEKKKEHVIDNASLKTAAVLWSKHCVSCHGERGRGDGPDAKTLEKSTPDFTADGFMSSRTDDDLFRKLTNGRRPMPGYKKKLSETQRWALVGFMRNLADAK